MNLLLGFAPFILFLILTRMISLEVALVVNAIITLVILARDWQRAKSFKILDAGNALLFCGLVVAVYLAPQAWTLPAARLVVDGGLLLIVLVSILIGRPFTLAYAREQVPQERWSDPRFIRANYIISGVWALAFLISFVANLVRFEDPSQPLWVNILAEAVSIGGAIWFTAWYPKRLRRQAQAAGASS